MVGSSSPRQCFVGEELRDGPRRSAAVVRAPIEDQRFVSLAATSFWRAGRSGRSIAPDPPVWHELHDPMLRSHGTGGASAASATRVMAAGCCNREYGAASRLWLAAHDAYGAGVTAPSSLAVSST